MKQPQNDTTISEAVLGQIKRGEVQMRPRSYFMLLSLSGALALASFLLVTTYAANLIILRLNALDAPAKLKTGNFSSALANFPWEMLLISVLSIGISISLLRKRHTYKRMPVWAILLAVISFAGIFGFGLTRTTINQSLEKKTPLKGLYQKTNTLKAQKRQKQEQIRIERQKQSTPTSTELQKQRPPVQQKIPQEVQSKTITEPSTSERNMPVKQY